MTETTPLHSEPVPVDTDFYDRHDIAQLIEATPAAVTKAIQRARLNIADLGQPLPGDIPLPDGYIGKAPWWRKTRIDEWLPTRRRVGQRGPARN